MTTPNPNAPVSIEIPSWLAKDLRDLAKAADRPFEDVVAGILVDWLSRKRGR